MLSPSKHRAENIPDLLFGWLDRVRAKGALALYLAEPVVVTFTNAAMLWCNGMWPYELRSMAR